MSARCQFPRWSLEAARRCRSWPIRTARRLLEQLADRREVIRARVRGHDEVYYLDPQATVPRTSRARTLVSPFDPVMWERGRTERLFGLHYRIEIYVPAAEPADEQSRAHLDRVVRHAGALTGSATGTAWCVPPAGR